MEPEERNRPKSGGRLLRWLAALSALAFFLVAALAAFIGYNLVRPIPKPLELPMSSLKPIAVAGQPTSSTLAAGTGGIRTTDSVTTTTSPMLELIPETAQPTPERRAAARAINARFAEVLADYAEEVAIEKKYPGREKQAYDRWRKELIANYVIRYDHLEKIVAQLQKDFPSDLDRFEAVYLGMLAERKDWGEAVNYCDRVRHDWNRSLYYNRQAEHWFQRSAGVGILGLRAAMRTLFPGSDA